jgi:hypothetical protein
MSRYDLTDFEWRVLQAEQDRRNRFELDRRRTDEVDDLRDKMAGSRR